jgi:hypothetical protein
VTIYLAWTGEPVDTDVAGPWVAMHRAAEGLTLLDSGESLSRVYHELKWSLPAGTALLVAPLDSRVKLSRLAAGTRSWLTSRGVG